MAGTTWKQARWDPLRKVRTAMRGLRLALLGDFSVAYKAVLSVLILSVTLYLRHWVDGAIVLLATVLVLSAELFNTSIEALCDIVQPLRDDRIATVKDVSAAATALAVFVWAGILVYEYATALMELMR